MPRSGITFSPKLEWILAARWGGYTVEQFFDLDGDDQSLIVAAFRAQQQIDGVVSKSMADEAKRKQPRKGRT